MHKLTCTEEEVTGKKKKIGCLNSLIEVLKQQESTAAAEYLEV